MLKFHFLLFFNLFLMLTYSAFAIEGDYKITDGKSPDGSSYGGSVVIKKSGQTYTLNWLIAKTGEQYSGIGILQDNVLAVAWGSQETFGVVNYKVSGAKLLGSWASHSTHKLGSEILEKSS